MRIDQYVYFAITSEGTSADEMAKRIGLEPDEVLVRGSKRPEPPRPAMHSWTIHASRPERPIRDQTEDVLGRIASVESAITGLIAELKGDVFPRLEIVRLFNDPDAAQTGDALLGWSLEMDHVQLLSRLGAFVDVDEYDGDDYEDEP